MDRIPRGDMVGRQVLIVEDELLIALETKQQVEHLGCAVLGPAGSVKAALDLLSAVIPDAALLDVNLRGQRVTPVARLCRDRGIPFVLVTGYGRLTLEEPLLQGAPRVRKPFCADDIKRALADAINGGNE